MYLHYLFYPEVHILRPFSLLSPHVPHDQPALTAATAIPFHELVQRASEMFRSPYSHIVVKGKEGSCTSVVTRKEGEAVSPLEIH